jgi:ASC-1-like (ASCH) protein
MNLPKSDYYLSIISTKQHPYIELIAEGKKKAEGRIYPEKIRKFSVNKILCLHNDVSYVLCKIISLNVYKSFEEMLLQEGISNMLPFTDSLNEAIGVYNSFPGAERVKIYGAVAIMLEPIEKSM